MYNQNFSSQQQPSRLSPTFSNPMPPIQHPAAQHQPMYGNRQSFGRSTSSVQDYTLRQHQNPSPPENNSSQFVMHRARQPSEAQSIYGTSIPQSLQMSSDNRYSIYSTNGHAPSQEMEFDASILYSSPTSAPPQNPAVPFSSPVPVSQNFQPNRRQEMTLDGSESYFTTPSNQATYLPRSQTIQVSDPATRRFQSHNVLRRRKTKAASALAPIPLKPVEPPAFQKPNTVPVYSLVAQAPLDASAKPTTPSFQTSNYSRPPLPPFLHTTSNPIQNSGPLQTATQQRTQSLPPILTSNQESTMIQGHLLSQNSSPTNQLTQTSAPTTTSGMMVMSQQSLSPLRAEATGGVPSAISSVPYMNSQLLGSTAGLSNGTMGASLNSTMNPTTSLMSMPYNPLDGYSNGMAALSMSSIPPMTLNQSQSLMSSQPQLNGLSNGTMTLSGAPLVSPTFIPSPQPQELNGFSNGLSGNNAMVHLQPNMLLNGYPQGLPSGVPATQVQGGMTSQVPEIMVESAAQKTGNKQNKQLMKKVGLSLLKFGSKYALKQIGIDESEIFANMEHLGY